MLNGRYFNEGLHRLNDDLAPYTNLSDPRLRWLETEFLGFFDAWERAVDQLPLSNSEKQRHLLSRQTRSGLYVTVKGFVGLIRWLLSRKDRPPYVLSSVFNQDRLEVYFGHVRSQGGSNEHPDLKQFQRIATALNFVDHCKLSAVRGSNITRSRSFGDK